MNCTGTLLLRDPVITLMCTEEAGHEGAHYDGVMLVKWQPGTKIGTSHVPLQGVEVWE